MTERPTNRRRWRIGELARAAGLSVRTLRHYEDIGLLAPPSRTHGHQRLYDEQQVRRLYRICALRELGFSLADIGRMLADDRAALPELLRAHRARVEGEIQRLESLRTLLDHACAHVRDDIEPDDAMATIEALSRVARRSKTRLEQGDVADDDEARWRALGDELRACMIAGEAPSEPRARALARAALARIVEFAGGDQATLEALARLRQLAPPQDLAGWDPALMQYLDQALASLQETETEHARRTDCEEHRTSTARHRLGAARQPEPSDGAAGDGDRRPARELAARVSAGARRSRSPRRAV